MNTSIQRAPGEHEPSMSSASTPHPSRRPSVILPGALLLTGALAALCITCWPAVRRSNGASNSTPKQVPVKNATSMEGPDTRPAAISGNNPLYTEYLELAEPHGIDVSFTQNVTVLGPADAALSEDALGFPVFCNAPKSLDVLLVGDSTMSWGVIPRVVSRLTGLRVGMFSFRAMYLNERTLRVVRRVRERYVRDGGVAIFGFDVWTQTMQPEAFRRGELVRLEGMSDAEFQAFADQRFAECGRAQAHTKARWVDSRRRGLPGLKEDIMRQVRKAAATHRDAVLPFTGASLKEYSSILSIVRARLHLPGTGDEHPVARAFRERIHPAYFNASRSSSASPPTEHADHSSGLSAATPLATESRGSRDAMAQTAESAHTNQAKPDAPLQPDATGKSARVSLSGIQFLRWDRETFTLTGPFRGRSIRSTAPGYDAYPVGHQQKRNARSLLDFPGRKVFLITFYSRHDLYMQQRSIFHTLYRDRLELLDLGRLHPEDRQFAMDEANHPANAGGMAKSILIGLWLREHFFSARNP